MATYVEGARKYTNDGKTIRAIMGHLASSGAPSPTPIEYEEMGGWFDGAMIRATGSTWRILALNGTGDLVEVEVSPKRVRMCIGESNGA